MSWASNLIERSPIPLLFALALIACDTEAPPLDYDGPHVEGVAAGPAPWDPIHVDWADEVTDPAWASFVAEEPTPVVLDTDGREVELVPLEREVWDDASQSYAASIAAWRPLEPLAPGGYEVVDPGGPSWPFEIEAAYGTDPAFDPASIVGRVYAVDGIGDAQTMSLVPLMEPHLQDLLEIEILAVDGDAVEFRLVADASEGRCALLSDVGSLSETGAFSWSLDELIAETEQEDVRIWDASMRAGFLADGSAAAGGEVELTVDVRPLSIAMFPEEQDPGLLCELSAGFGEHCHPCEDGAEGCYSPALYQIAFAPIDVEVRDDLPWCGVDMRELDDEIPEINISCDFDLDLSELDWGCSAMGGQAGFPLGAMLLTIFARRRRPER